MFTFVDLEKETLSTVESNSEDFNKISKNPDYFAGSAMLVDNSKPKVGGRHIVHYVPLDPSCISRVFTRVEHNIVNSTVARIPAFSYQALGKTGLNYCFAYKERVIYTEDSNFHTAKLSSLES